MIDSLRSRKHIKNQYFWTQNYAVCWYQTAEVVSVAHHCQAKKEMMCFQRISMLLFLNSVLYGSKEILKMIEIRKLKNSSVCVRTVLLSQNDCPIWIKVQDRQWLCYITNQSTPVYRCCLWVASEEGSLPMHSVGSQKACSSQWTIPQDESGHRMW